MKINVIKQIDEYCVGDYENIQHTITEMDVNQFAKLTGDYNPLHLDSAFAETTTFKKPVVYGMLSASFISTLIGMKIPGPGALWTSQTLEFIHQVYIGDTLNIVAVVKQVSTATKTLVLSISAQNQNKQEVLKGEATVKLLETQKKEKKLIEGKKVCLITGGTSDIGSVIAEKLAHQGVSVALNYNRSDVKAEYIRDAIKSTENDICIYRADIAEKSQVENMVREIEEKQGKITMVVHCAAPRNIIQGFDSLSWENVQQQIDTQVKGLYNCMQIILPQMVEQGIEGRIVCMSSIAADDVPPAKQYDYVLAKAAMASLAKSLAVEYSPHKISINLIAPGMVETERIADLPHKAKLMTKMQSPARSLVEVEEVADTALFLLMRKSCSVTGETIRVCGGIKML